jgi:hypothetical protein
VNSELCVGSIPSFLKTLYKIEPTDDELLEVEFGGDVEVQKWR